MAKVYPIDFSGKIHEDYVGVTNEKEHRIRWLELKIKEKKQEVEIYSKMLVNMEKELKTLQEVIK